MRGHQIPKSVSSLVLRVAPRETTVLLIGEPGTGKAAVARVVHRLSRHAKECFTTVDCAAVTGRLFAGGKLPKSGTLYFDGVGDLGAAPQGELLRRLPCLSGRNLRLIFSGGRDLAEAVEREAFSPDLYYRISVFPIRLPPLRERREDLKLLALRMLTEIHPSMEIDPRTFSVLEAHPFPGNLDELRAILEHACLETEGFTIRPDHLRTGFS